MLAAVILVLVDAEKARHNSGVGEPENELCANTSGMTSDVLSRDSDRSITDPICTIASFALCRRHSSVVCTRDTGHRRPTIVEHREHTAIGVQYYSLAQLYVIPTGQFNSGTAYHRPFVQSYSLHSYCRPPTIGLFIGFSVNIPLTTQLWVMCGAPQMGSLT